MLKPTVGPYSHCNKREYAGKLLLDHPNRRPTSTWKKSQQKFWTWVEPEVKYNLAGESHAVIDTRVDLGFAKGGFFSRGKITMASYGKM